MMKVRIDNVKIVDLLSLLTQLREAGYDIVDIVVDEEKKSVILDPISSSIREEDIQLTDDNIIDLI